MSFLFPPRATIGKIDIPFPSWHREQWVEREEQHKVESHFLLDEIFNVIKFYFLPLWSLCRSRFPNIERVLSISASAVFIYYQRTRTDSCLSVVTICFEKSRRRQIPTLKAKKRRFSGMKTGKLNVRVDVWIEIHSERMWLERYLLLGLSYHISHPKNVSFVKHSFISIGEGQKHKQHDPRQSSEHRHGLYEISRFISGNLKYSTFYIQWTYNSINYGS